MNGSFQGKLFDLGTYPGAIPSEDPENRVIGEIHRLEDPGSAFVILDRYEGREYDRVLQPVRSESGQTFEAWIYLFVAGLSDSVQVDSGDYLERISTP